MKKRALKKENERLRGELLKASRTISDLHYVRVKDADEIKSLRADLLAEKEKYAALLEKYIAMMEARIKE